MRNKPPTVALDPKLAARARIAIVRAEYNSELTSSMERKCVETLVAAGVPAARIAGYVVPGCFEIPVMAQRLAQRKQYDVIIALGVVIRGDTYHFELVANECARGIMDVSLRFDVPIVFEVLAVYRRADAVKRAANNRMNKGIEAAGTALAMLAKLKSL